MATWQEIKKLAADLHRVQLGDAAKKLSERNCIEIVANLIESGLLYVVHSIDGKDYITNDHLSTQIINETIGNGGRISLSDLQQSLNVHYQTIEDQAKQIVETQAEFTFCLGQLITRDYFNKICDEINEKLQEEGRLTFSQITKSYDLPTDLLRSEIYSALNKGRIRGAVDKNDSSILYTDTYVHEQTAVLRGSLSALTRPMPVSKLISEIGVEPGLFLSCFDELSVKKEIKGSLTGGRHIERAVFVPDLFVELTENYIKDFYHQNSYIEIASLKKLNVSDSSSYLSKLIDVDAKSLVHLKDVVISGDTFEHVESSVDEAIARHRWADLASHLPFPLSVADQNALANLLHKKHLHDWTLCGDIYFYKEDLATSFVRFFEPFVTEKAQKEGPNVAKMLRQTSQNVSTANEFVVENKKGKGAKGKKGKGQPQRDDDATSATNQLEFMSKDELVKTVMQSDAASNCPEEIVEEICEKLESVLNSKYRSQVESVYLMAESVNLKKSHGEFGDKFHLLFQNICLFDAGTDIFNDSISEQLKVYLLRSLVTDLVNLTIGYYAHVPNALQMTPKIRDATVEEMSSAAKQSFQKLIGSLNGKDLNGFYDAIDEISAPNICSLNVRRPEKKLRTDLMSRQKDELTAQLNDCDEATTGLLLACLLLTVQNLDAMVHASGKFVPHLVTVLQDKIPKSIYSLVSETQKLVVQQMKTKDPMVAEETKKKFRELKCELLNKTKSSEQSEI